MMNKLSILLMILTYGSIYREFRILTLEVLKLILKDAIRRPMVLNHAYA